MGGMADGEVGVVAVAFPRMAVWLSAMLIRVRIWVRFPVASKWTNVILGVSLNM